MAETLHLELSGSPASADLIDYLAARRLAARLIDTGDCCELAFATSADERLRNATRQALRGWIAEPAGSLVVAEHEGRFVLRPPAV